ncbi:MAG: hypothetical protein DDG60_16680 [Anaerolineae bacterium]|nr:MAG: hypothetical protein DDG60_16680 [Anaerolineae bacterium]
MQTFFRRQIALPQEHGAWVFLLSPLLIGLFVGNAFHIGSIFLVMAAISAFLIRQPVTIAVKAGSGRRPKSDLPAAAFWIALYGFLLLLAIGGLLYLGYTSILLLALPAGPVFGWHLWLVSRREERRQAGVEILATGVLALSAPAAFWIGRQAYDPLGWILWILTWFQSAASIVYAYLRLEQRNWLAVPHGFNRLRAGWRALAYTGFNLVFSASLGAIGLTPPLIFLPYLLQFSETAWGTLNPALGARPVAIGVRQLIISSLFTALFIAGWR